ncbi:MAG: A17 family peptidase, partial [Gammaproteobacteria bacterium]|nr:A17 family peptidase [Gammaproteobacteria bacterium]
YEVAICSDVSEMFLNVRLKEDDRKYHRFLWEDEDSNLIVYEFFSHMFGNTGSPSVAIFTIKEEAREQSQTLPVASDIVIWSSIVDDNLDSTPTEEEAWKAISELVTLFKGCGMRCCKFGSNRPQVLCDLDENLRGKDFQDLDRLVTSITERDYEKTPQTKALGQKWDIARDVLTFEPRHFDLTQKITLRVLLSNTGKIFDPLGFVTPVTVQARRICQSCWTHKLTYDDPATEEITKEWQDWAQSLPHITKMEIPRCLIRGDLSDLVSLELHVFTDASIKAYAAAAYLVTERKIKGTTIRDSNLVMSRAKITPLKQKPLTVPKLELLGAELGTLVLLQANDVLKVNLDKCFLWTDSICVIAWLQLDAKGLQIFVANRSRKIHTRIKAKNIQPCPGTENPADIPSRGINAKDLVESELWLKGPHWLCQSPDTWPEQREDIIKDISSEDQDKVLSEMKKSVRNEITNEQIMCSYLMSEQDLEKSLLEDQGIYLERSQESYDQFRECSLEPDTLNRKILEAQAEGFQRTLHEVRTHGRVLATNRLKNLRPWIDRKGLLRLGGRLRGARHLTLAYKHPILLHPKHPLTKHLIRYHHEEVLAHSGGFRTLLSKMNEKYWIMNRVATIKRFCSECILCKQVGAKKPQRQVMAPLPQFRIPSKDRPTPRVFETVFMDAAGPWETRLERGTRGTRRNKRWMIVFRDALYGAIHVEMAYNMSAEGFLMAYDRFVSRRNWPKRTISDHGGNFVRGMRLIIDPASGTEHTWSEASRRYWRSRGRDRGPLLLSSLGADAYPGG